MTSSISASVTAPIAAKNHHEFEIHGDKITDDYAWLRDKENPEVIAYLNAENDFTEATLAPYTELREQLFQELKSRIKEDDNTVPAKSGNYYYYSKVVAGKQYRVYCRKHNSLTNDEELLLDTNQLAEGESYFSLGAFDISPNHQLLAYSTDTDGSEEYLLQFKNLETGELLGDRIPNTYYSSAWANDNQTLYYTVLDENSRPYRLYRHHLGQPVEQDELLYEELDPQFFVGCSKSRDDRYIFLEMDGKITSEAYFLDANDPQAQFTLIEKRQKGIEYSVTHHQGNFYILTNDCATNFRIVKTPVSQPQKQHWQDFIPHNPDCYLEGIEEFKDFLVIYERIQGLERIKILSLLDHQAHYIEFDDPTYAIGGSSNYEFDTHVFRFAYTSMVQPLSVYDYDMRSRTKTILKQEEVPGGYDSSLYTSERIFATSHDGAQVPISLVYRKGLERDGSHPLYLYGYGSYGASMSAYFSANRLSLLDRGFVFAIAHIRGGSEMGRQWYEDGKFLKKKNTFYDFVACAEHLAQEKYTSKGNIAISGGSAGGLLIGATINLKPDLFKAAVADVPFVDVLNTMLDESLPLTQLEYDEWGNPNQYEYYQYIRSYSPYDNVQSKAYPNLLVTGGLNDPRVTYWEPAKWTAKLRTLKQDTNWLLLKTNMDAGHGGASGRYESLKEVALEFTFILAVFGLA
ncbi:S9 family peptidase [Tumidithrix helvetica PCC 7403]|uniref:S9 family peptidase n=1 Tax=Tumidithrix helvetica TaxID=3457545 RepID=UPI003C8C3AEC